MRFLSMLVLFTPLILTIAYCAPPSSDAEWAAYESEQDSIEKMEQHTHLLSRIHEITLSDGTRCAVVWSDWEKYSSISCNWVTQPQEEEGYF